MSDIVQILETLEKSFLESVESVVSEADLLNLKSEYLGKKGKVSEVLKGLRNATPDERKKLILLS